MGNDKKTALFTTRKYFDKIYNYLNAFLTFIIIILSVMTSYDYPALKLKFPNWSSLINLLSEYSFPILLIIAFSAFILTVLRLLLSIDKTIIKLDKELNQEKDKNSIIGDNIKNMFDGYLFHLATGKLGFSENNDRVTLYLHDQIDKN